jgi:hypothetical protein
MPHGSIAGDRVEDERRRCSVGECHDTDANKYDDPHCEGPDVIAFRH